MEISETDTSGKENQIFRVTPPITCRLHEFRTENPEQKYRYRCRPTHKKLIPCNCSSGAERPDHSEIIEECEVDKRGYVNGIHAPRLNPPHHPLTKQTRSITPPPRPHPTQILSQKFRKTALIANGSFNTRTLRILPSGLPSPIDHIPRHEIIIVCIQRSHKSEEGFLVGEFPQKGRGLDDFGSQGCGSAGDDEATAVDSGCGTDVKVVLFEVETAEDVAECCWAEGVEGATDAFGGADYADFCIGERG